VRILRDVLGFSACETGAVLEATPVLVDSALQRAHKTVDERLPERSQQATLRSLGDAALRDIVDRYIDAWKRSDIDALVAMLAEDARITMPPIPTWYAGREAVAGFLRGWPLACVKRWRLLPASVSGQLAFGHYTWKQATRRFAPHGVNLHTLHGAQISEITTFLSPEAFPRFGLPDAVQP
jgi:RNA polymerase sigma-70 factor (ECF subfamily)